MTLKTRDKTLKSTSAAQELVLLKIKGLGDLILIENGTYFLKATFESISFTFKNLFFLDLLSRHKNSFGCSDVQGIVVC